jgi:hypothetical protein
MLIVNAFKNGGGGGSRTIRAYSFYVTYWKHRNARTAKPSVCPPPMYKIVYKKSEGRLTSRFLNAGLRSLPSRIQENSPESFSKATFVSSPRDAGGVPRHGLYGTAGEPRRG